jgi:hypothetical protein
MSGVVVQLCHVLVLALRQSFSFVVVVVEVGCLSGQLSQPQ